LLSVHFNPSLAFPSQFTLTNMLVGGTALGALALHVISWWPTRALAEQDGETRKGDGNLAAISVLVNIIVFSFTLVEVPNQIVCVPALGGTSGLYVPQLPLMYAYWILTSPQTLFLVFSLLPSTVHNLKTFRRAEVALFVCLAFGILATFLTTPVAYGITLAIAWLSGLLLFFDLAVLVAAALKCVPAQAPKVLVWFSGIVGYLCWLLVPSLYMVSQAGAWPSQEMDLAVTTVFHGFAKGGIVLLAVSCTNFTERSFERAKMALAEAKRKHAEAASDARRAFLRWISHEVRLPLSSGTMVLEEMKDRLEDADLGPADIKSLRESTEIGLASISTVIKLLSDFLSLEKIEEGKISLEAAPFNVQEWIHQIADQFSGSVKLKKIHLDTSVSEAVPRRIIGDASRLQQIVSNLTSNAIKFTKAEGHVSIYVTIASAPVASLAAVPETIVSISPTAYKTCFASFLAPFTPSSASRGSASSVALFSPTAAGSNGHSLSAASVAPMPAPVPLLSSPFVGMKALPGACFDEAGMQKNKNIINGRHKKALSAASKAMSFLRRGSSEASELQAPLGPSHAILAALAPTPAPPTIANTFSRGETGLALSNSSSGASTSRGQAGGFTMYGPASADTTTNSSDGATGMGTKSLSVSPAYSRPVSPTGEPVSPKGDAFPARKMNFKGSALSSSVSNTAKFLFIAVTDQGVGLTPEEKDKLFQPFSQLRDGENRGGFHSSGLGLMFCRKIVDLHQGEIGVESEKGKGSTFYFRIPLVVPENDEPSSPVATSDHESPKAVTSHQTVTMGMGDRHLHTSTASKYGSFFAFAANETRMDDDITVVSVATQGSFGLPKFANSSTVSTHAGTDHEPPSGRLSSRTLANAGTTALASSLPMIAGATKAPCIGVGTGCSMRQPRSAPFAPIKEDEGGGSCGEYVTTSSSSSAKSAGHDVTVACAAPSMVSPTSVLPSIRLPEINPTTSSTKLKSEQKTEKASVAPTAAAAASNSDTVITVKEPGQKLCIVVDDEMLNRTLFSRLLERKHKNMKVVIQAESGQDAVDKLAAYCLQTRGQQQPKVTSLGVGDQMNGLIDCVFTDGSMPGTDGYEFTALLRATGYLGPILGVTGNGLLEDQKKFLDCGANGSLSSRPLRRLSRPGWKNSSSPNCSNCIPRASGNADRKATLK
jgi:signal transduction histidine kinase/CheY-like chemotaxis protein